MERQQPRVQSNPTVVDVARLAGVSVATVSRVLNDHPRVTEMTRNKVSLACDRLGYIRNVHAASLRTGTSKMISVIVANLRQPWYSQITSALKQHLQELDYGAAVHDLKNPSHSWNDISELPGVVSRISPRESQGVIVCVAGMIEEPEIIQSLYQLAERIPLVVVGQPIKAAPWATVTFLDRAAARHAVEYLHSKGRKRIAFLGRAPSSYFAGERQNGYEDAVRHLGTYDSELIWSVDGHEFRHGYDAMLVQLDRAIEFDAIFATNDELAIGAMRLLNQRGISVPDDVAIIGFGDSDTAAYLPSTTLTSVDGPAEEAATCVSHTLMNLIQNRNSEPGIHYLERQLILRESTGD